MNRIVLCISLAYLTAMKLLPKIGERLISPFRMNWMKPEYFSLNHRNVVDGLFMDKFITGINFPQVLPYVVIRSGGMYLTYSRKRGEEVRLHGTRSIGFGGHIDLPDVSSKGEIKDVILKACERELQEEIGLHLSNFEERVVFNHSITDYTNTVGMVHFGIFAVVDLDNAEWQTLNIDPDEISDARWLTAAELKADNAMYESWSQAIILNEGNVGIVK